MSGLGLEVTEFYTPTHGRRYWIANGALTLDPFETFEVDLPFGVPVRFVGFTDNPRDLKIVRCVYDETLIQSARDMRERPIQFGGMWAIQNNRAERRKVSVSMLFHEAKEMHAL